MKKTLITILVTVLVCGSVFGTTLALLMDSTAPITNTFTVGDIQITLDESDDLDLKMVPGKEITKDPVVTVTAKSEDCYLFVKIEKGGNFDDFMTYAMADGWTELKTGVYYREVSYSDSDQPFHILKNDQVLVNADLTQANLASAAPTLTFTAYAVQQLEVDSATDAWANFEP